MSFFIPLCFCICIAGTGTMLSRQRFEVALPSCLMLSALLVYTAGVLGSMEAGVVLIVAAALAYPVYLAAIFVRNREKAKTLAFRLLTPGFAIFLFIYICVFILDLKRGMVWLDEHSHWGLVVKEMYRINDFYCSAESSARILFKRYPPIIPVFEYIWCKLSGGYVEAYLYRALHVLALSLFLPAAKRLSWAKGRSAFPVIVLFTAIAFVSCNIISMGCYLFTSLLIDCFLGVLFAYCLCIPMLDPNRSVCRSIRICTALSFFILSKYSGTFFALLLVIYYLVMERAQRAESIEKPKKRGALLCNVLMFLIPAAFLFSWRMVLNNSLPGGTGVVNNVANSLLSLGGTGGIQPYQKETLEEFVKAVFCRPLATQPFTLTFPQLWVLGIGLFLGGASGSAHIFRSAPWLR